MNRIKKDARRSQRSAYAEGTFDNLNTQWVKYIAFCLYFRLCALPASTATLVWYVQFLSKGLKSHSSLISYLSGVKKLHTFLGFLTTGFSGIALKLMLMGMRCLNPHIPRRARPITPALLKTIHSKLDMNKASDIIFWLICLMAFFLLFRKSNLLPDTSKGFNPRRQLKVGDCMVKNGKLVIGIHWEKNEQFNRELLTFPLPVLGESILCPVTAFLAGFESVPTQKCASFI